MLLLIVALLLTVPGLAQRSLVISWTQPPTTGWTACSAGTLCLTGYTLYEITTGIPVAIANAPEGATSLTIQPQPSIGSHTYELIHNGINGSGQPMQSTDNPGIVVNCKKNGSGRVCRAGKSWN